MAHRRKSSHPVYRTRKMQTSIPGDEQEYPGINMKPCDEQINADRLVNMLPDCEKHLDIPQDLFKDFEVLRNATKLGTADLMRKLLTDYSRCDNDLSSMQPKEKMTASPEPTRTKSQGQGSPLPQHQYNSQPMEAGEGTTGHQQLQPNVLSQTVFEEREPGEITRCYYNADTNMPLDLSVIKAEKAMENPAANFDMKWKYIQEPTSAVKQEVPTQQMIVAGNNMAPGNHVGNVIPLQPNQGCMYVYPVGFTPQAPGQVGMLGGTAIAQNEPAQVAMIPQILPQAVSAPMEPVKTVAMDMPQTVPTRIAKGPRGGSRRNSNANQKNAGQGKMKLLTENTLFPGVYTSILKLPWSRRSRSSKHNLSSHSEPSQQSSGMKLPISQPAITNSPVSVTNLCTNTSQGQHFMSESSQSLMMVYPHATTTSNGKPVRKRGRPPKLPMLAKLLAESNKKSKLEIHVANQNPFQMLPQPVGIMMGAGTSVYNVNQPNAVPVVSPQSEIPTPVPVSIGVDCAVPAVSAPISAPILIAPTPVANQNMPITSFHQQPITDFQQQAGNLNLAVANQNLPTVPTPVTEVNGTSSGLGLNKDTTSAYTMTTTTMTSTASGALYQEMILSSKSLVNVRPRKRQTTNELLKSKSSSSQNFICTSFRIRPRLSSMGSSQKVEEMVKFVRNRRKKLLGYKQSQAHTESSKMSTMSQREPSVSQQKLSSYLKKNKATKNMVGTNETVDDVLELNDGSSSLPCKADREKNEQTSCNNEDESSQVSEIPQEYTCVENGCSDNINGDHKSNPSENNFSDDEDDDDDDDDIDKNDSTQNMFQELYHCKVCNEIIAMDEKFEHMATHVHKEKVCSSCGEQFQCYSNKDIENNETNQQYLCDSCSETSDVSFKKVLPRQSQGIMCDDCGLHFKKFSAYYKHRTAAHTEKFTNMPSDNHFCQKCGKFFVSSKGLCYHMKIHEKKTIPCPVADCPRLFSKKTQLNSHIRDHHDKQKQFGCIYDGCSKKFMKNFHLQEHIRVKHFNIRAYKCTWADCGKEFAAERHLKVHLLIHKDEKPMKCEYCDYRCRQRNAMNWHMRKHPEAPYKYRKYAMLGLSGSGQESD
ncbi:hypothetical protein ScPMuIL_009173 [Solemya velum]